MSRSENIGVHVKSVDQSTRWISDGSRMDLNQIEMGQIGASTTLEIEDNVKIFVSRNPTGLKRQCFFEKKKISSTAS